MPRKRMFESPPPRPTSEVKPPPRILMMSEEEKRRMIEAHAARRAPEDRSQLVSLWAGVAICLIAIGAGWAYAMRQAIANAIQPTFDTAQLSDLPGTITQVFEDKKNANTILQDVDQVMDRLKQLQAADGYGAQLTEAVTNVVRQVNEEMKSNQASPSSTGDKPTLPKGLVTDN